MISSKDNPNLHAILENVVGKIQYRIGNSLLYQALGFLDGYCKKTEPFGDMVKNLEIKFIQNIKINGPNCFNILVYNMKCTYLSKINSHNRGKIEYNETDIESFKFFGIKILDLFRLYNLNNNERDFNDDKKLYKKIMKVNNNEEKNDIVAYAEKSTDYTLKFIDTKDNSKRDHNVKNFANGVVIFSGASNLTNYFRDGILDRQRQNMVFDKDSSIIIVNNMLTKANKVLIQNLINNYYFNVYNISDIVEYKDIIFDEPRSLLEIMEEFYHEEYAYSLLKKLVKENDVEEMLFKSPRCFKERDRETVKIEYFNKIYFQSWNLNPIYFANFEIIIKDKLRKKIKKNDEYYRDDRISDKDFYRSNKKGFFNNIISEGFDEFEDL